MGGKEVRKSSSDRIIYSIITHYILLTCLLTLLPAVAWCQTGWQDDLRLTDDPEISFPPPNNGKYIIADLDGNIHVVWADMRDRNFEIYHKIRTDGVWSVDERLTSSAGDSKRPVLALDGIGRVHLVWNDLRDGNKEIYHRIWDGSWGAETRVSFTDGDSYASSLAADGFVLHLVYQEEVNGYLQIIYRSFDVFLWSAAQQLSFVESGMSMVPTVATAPDGSVHVAWWDTREDSTGAAEGKIGYRCKTDSWSDEEIISGPLADAMRPNILVDDSGYVHVAWIDKREPDEQIYYRKTGQYGWEDEICLTSGDYTHYHPSLTACGDLIHLVFWANNPSSLNSGIFHMSSESGTWGGPARISDGSSQATLCCLNSEPDGTLHAAWKDTRDGNEEIYYNTFIPSGTGIGDDEEPELPGLEEFPLTLVSFPNPSTGATRISFQIPAICDVDLRIYDIRGRLVRKIAGERYARGIHPFIWDGRDERGNEVATGVYIARGRAGKLRASSKILLLR